MSGKNFDKFIKGVQLPENMEPPAHKNAHINARKITYKNAYKNARIIARKNVSKNARKSKKELWEQRYIKRTVYIENELWKRVKASGEYIKDELNKALRQYYGL